MSDHQAGCTIKNIPGNFMLKVPQLLYVEGTSTILCWRYIYFHYRRPHAYVSSLETEKLIIFLFSKKKICSLQSQQLSCYGCHCSYVHPERSISVVQGLGRCPWCNRYRHWKWAWRTEFKSWTRLFAFHIARIPLGNVCIQLFSLKLWVDWNL